jgi:hypothetical protein
MAVVRRGIVLFGLNVGDLVGRCEKPLSAGSRSFGCVIPNRETLWLGLALNRLELHISDGNASDSAYHHPNRDPTSVRIHLANDLGDRPIARFRFCARRITAEASAAWPVYSQEQLRQPRGLDTQPSAEADLFSPERGRVEGL